MKKQAIVLGLTYITLFDDAFDEFYRVVYICNNFTNILMYIFMMYIFMMQNYVKIGCLLR